MADISAFSCFKCGLNPSNGVSAIRMNATGQKGIWACKAHAGDYNLAIVDAVEELEALVTMSLDPRQAAELLGARFVDGS